MGIHKEDIVNHRSRPWIVGASLLLGLGRLACASDVNEGFDAFDRNLPHTKAALHIQGDADSLAAAALFSDREAGLNALTRAVALAPDRPDLVWLQILTCARIPGCDPEPYAAALHRVDPDNGAAWAALVDRAARRGDLVAETKYLKAIGAAKRYDIYWNATIARMSGALLKVRAADIQTILVAVVGYEAAFAIPAYTNVSKACKSPVLEALDRLDDCRHVASVMRNGDTYVTEMIGIAIAQRVWPADGAEHADAVAARRLGKYRMATEATLTSKLATPDDAERYLELLRTHRSEQEVAQTLIVAAGKDASPPPEWQE